MFIICLGCATRSTRLPANISFEGLNPEQSVGYIYQFVSMPSSEESKQVILYAFADSQIRAQKIAHNPSDTKDGELILSLCSDIDDGSTNRISELNDSHMLDMQKTESELTISYHKLIQPNSITCISNIYQGRYDSKIIPFKSK